MSIDCANWSGIFKKEISFVRKHISLSKSMLPSHFPSPYIFNAEVYLILIFENTQSYLMEFTQEHRVTSAQTFAHLSQARPRLLPDW